MMDVVVILIILLMVGSALRYIIRAKKKGIKCIGCPMAGRCGSGHDKDEPQCGCDKEQ